MMTDIKLSEEKRPGILFKEKAFWGPVGSLQEVQEVLEGSEEQRGKEMGMGAPPAPGISNPALNSGSQLTYGKKILLPS